MAGYSKGSSSSRSGRLIPYGLMLLLAFGASFFGVMILHNMRERRLFTLLIKDKDQQVLALHLLFQKERDSTIETKRKIDEAKAEAVDLRTQKTELTNKLLELQSRMASLKEEERNLEAALEEKNDKIKTLLEKDKQRQDENRQLIAITELLKQKEATIEKLKHRLENPTKVLSVSTDDPSKPYVSITATENVLSNVEDSASESRGGSEDWQSEKSTNSHDGKDYRKRDESATNAIEANTLVGDDSNRRDENGDNNELEDKDEGGISEEGRLDQKLEHLQGYGRRGRGYHKSRGEGEERREISTDAQTYMVESSRNGLGLKMNDANGNSGAMQAKDQGISRDAQRETLEISQDDEVKEKNMYSNDRKNMGISQHLGNDEGSTMRSKHGYRNKFGSNRQGAISKEEDLDKDRNSREHVNLSRQIGIEEEKNVMAAPERQGVLQREKKERIETTQEDSDLRMIDGSGHRKVSDGSELRDSQETASDDDPSKMRQNPKDRKSSEGNGQAEVSDEGQMELLMRADKEVIITAEGDKQEADPSINGKLELPKISQIVILSTEEVDGHEVPEDNGDDVRVKRENETKFKSEDESETVSSDKQLGINENSQYSRTENGKSLLDGKENSVIVRNEAGDTNRPRN